MSFPRRREPIFQRPVILGPPSRGRRVEAIRFENGVDGELELAAADLRPGVRAGIRQPRRACRRRDGLARGDRFEPIRQNRFRDQPDPQSVELRTQPQPHAAAGRRRRAPYDRGHDRRRQSEPADAISLPRQHRENGDPGLAGAHRRHQRDRHRDPLCPGRHAGQACERDHRTPRGPHDPDRRLSRRVAARSPAGRAELCRLVARDAAAAAQGPARRNRARLSRSSRPAPAQRRCERGGRKTLA